MSRDTPTYDLETVQAFVRAGSYAVTMSAARGARNLYLDESDILDCVCELTERDFYKTMPSKKRSGTFQDVYKPRYHGFAIYLKVSMPDDRAIVISFKQDQDA